MAFSKIVVSVAAIGLFGVAIAQDQTRVQIEVIADDTDHEVVRIELDSDDMDFNLHDMQEGENRSIVDKDGRAILVTRNADGYSFDVDGKTIDMPLMADGHHGKVGKPVHMDGTMIMTGKPVDEATQQAIRSLLESAGHGSEVRFVDREGIHEKHQVHVIEKRVEIVD